MKKSLYHVSILVIVCFNSFDSLAQLCYSNPQDVYFDMYPPVVCANSGSFILRVTSNYVYSIDEYGWQDEYYSYSNIVVKNPAGTAILTIGEYELVCDMHEGYYAFPTGFFNMVGDWTFSFNSIDYCYPEYNYNVTRVLKVEGATSNLITADQVICSSGGTPNVILNISAAANAPFTYSWQSKTTSGSWLAIGGSTGESYQPPYINQTTSYRRIITTSAHGCSNISNTVTKSVYPALTNGSISPASQNVCYNVFPATITESVAPTGGSSYPNYSYMWYVSPNNSNWTSLSVTTKNYTPSYVSGLRYYRRATIDPSCGTTYTNSVTVNGYSDVVAATIGSPQTICYGTDANPIVVSSAESGGNNSFTYQWYSSPDNSTWSPVSSATGSNYAPTGLTTPTYYRKACITSCKTVYTNSVFIDVRTDLSPGKIGSNSTICNGVQPSLIATTENPTGASNSYTYQWYKSSDNVSWSEISGATSPAYQPPALYATTYYKKLVIDPNCIDKYTNTVTITVRNNFEVGIIGSAQTICYGSVPTLLSTAISPSGGTGSLTYQWEYSTDNINWTLGPTTESYQPPALNVTTYYRRKVTDFCGSGYNPTVTITVRDNFNIGTIGPAQTICINTTPEMLMSAIVPSGGANSYTFWWESSLNGTDFNTISGATEEKYQPGPLPQTMYYRRHITDASCGSGYSNIIKTTVRNSFSAGAIGSDQAICYNSVPSILNTPTPPSGGSGSYTYKWFSSNDNANWTELSGQTGDTYQPPALIAKTYYRKYVKDACGDGYTNTVILTVRPIVDVGTIEEDQTICYGSNAELITTAIPASGGTGVFTYKWEKSTDNNSWTVIQGATGEGFQPVRLNETTYYRRQIINACYTGYNNTIIINVRPVVIPGVISNSQTICHATVPALLTTNSTPTGGTGSFAYQWQNSINNVSWTDIAGAANETYQPPALYSSTYYRRKEIAGYCDPVISNSILITVNNPLTPGTIKSNQTICYNTVPAILLNETYPTGGTGSYTYTWQKLEGTNWVNIQNATTDNYLSPALNSTTYFRRSETSGACGTVYSNQITITMRPDFIAGVIGTVQTINYNSIPAELTSLQSATGGTGSFTYQWQSSLDNINWSNIPLATDETYQPFTLKVTSYFKRLTTSGPCGAKETNIVVINVNPDITAGQISQSQRICYNSVPLLLTTTEPPGGGNNVYLLQWQKKEDDTDWSDITFANSETYQPPTLTKTTYYRKKVTSASLIAYSNFVTIEVVSEIQTPVTTLKESYCTGSNISIKISNPLYTSYKWYDASKNYLMDASEFSIQNLNGSVTMFVRSFKEGCLSDFLEQKLVEDPVKAKFTQDITVVAKGNPVKFTNLSTNAAFYTWNFFDGDLIHEENPVHYYNTIAGLKANRFDVKLSVISPGTCKDSITVIDAVTVSDYVGFEDPISDKFKYYPNPVTSKLYIDGTRIIKSVRIYSATSMLLRAYEFSDNKIAIDLSHLIPGFYILKIQDINKTIEVLKLLKL